MSLTRLNYVWLTTGAFVSCQGRENPPFAAVPRMGGAQSQADAQPRPSRVVTGAMPAARTRAFVSGLLIGAELAAAMGLMGAAPGPVTSVAAPKLYARYASAAAHLGITLQTLQLDAVYGAALGVFLDQLDAP